MKFLDDAESGVNDADLEMGDVEPEIQEFYQRFKVCPIFLLCDAEQRTCEVTNCRNNLYYDDPQRRIRWKRQDTEHSRLMRNCVPFGVCNLLRDMTLEEIGALWSLSREMVRQVIDKVLFGRKGLGNYIKNRPDLRTEFSVTARQLARFEPEAERVENYRKMKDAQTIQYRSLQRREARCRTRQSRIHSGQTQRLNP